MRFYARKILRLILVVFAVALMTFLLVSLLPGDIVYAIAGQDASPQEIDRRGHGEKHGRVARADPTVLVFPTCRATVQAAAPTQQRRFQRLPLATGDVQEPAAERTA